MWDSCFFSEKCWGSMWEKKNLENFRAQATQAGRMKTVLASLVRRSLVRRCPELERKTVENFSVLCSVLSLSCCPVWLANWEFSWKSFDSWPRWWCATAVVEALNSEGSSLRSYWALQGYIYPKTSYCFMVDFSNRVMFSRLTLENIVTDVGKSWVDWWPQCHWVAVSEEEKILCPRFEGAGLLLTEQSQTLKLDSRRDTWLILPVVICLSQRLSHACLSTSLIKVKPRMAH